MSKQLTSAVDLFDKSYTLVKRNLKMFVLLYSVSAVTVLISTIDKLSNAKADKSSFSDVFGGFVLGGGFHTNFPAKAGILLIVLTLVSVVFGLMTTILCLRSAQGHTPNFDTIWNEFTKKWLWLKLLALLICMGIAIAIGIVLLIVPGVILLWRLMFAPYILIDQHVDISEAFVRSWEMTKGHAWAIYSVILFSILLGCAAIVPVVGGIIALLLGIAYAVAPALRYQEIKKLSS